MQERTRASLVVPAQLSLVLETVLDLEAYPSWAAHVRDVTVLDRGADGLPNRAVMTMDAGLLKDHLDLAYAVETGGGTARVRWSLVRGGPVTALDGAYELTAVPEGTLVAYELEVAVALPVITALRRKAEAAIVDVALRDLSREVTRRASRFGA